MQATPEFTMKALSFLARTFRPTPDRAALDGICRWLMRQGLSQEEVRAAVNGTLEHATFFPTPAEILKRARMRPVPCPPMPIPPERSSEELKRLAARAREQGWDRFLPKTVERWAKSV